MEKVARGRQDAIQSKEIAEALQCLLNGWFVVEFLQSFCETLHSDVVAVRLQGHKVVSLSLRFLAPGALLGMCLLQRVSQQADRPLPFSQLPVGLTEPFR